MRDSNDAFPRNSVLSRVHMFENQALEKQQTNPSSSPSANYRPAPSPGRRFINNHMSPVAQRQDVEVQERFASPIHQENHASNRSPSMIYRQSTPSPGRRASPSYKNFSPESAQRQDDETREVIPSAQREPEECALPVQVATTGNSTSKFSQRSEEPGKEAGAPLQFHRSTPSPGRRLSEAKNPKPQRDTSRGDRFSSPRREPDDRFQPTKANTRNDSPSPGDSGLPFARLSAARPGIEPEGVKRARPTNRATSSSPVRLGHVQISTETGLVRLQDNERQQEPQKKPERQRAVSTTRGQRGEEHRPLYSPYITFRKAIEDPIKEKRDPLNSGRLKARDVSPDRREEPEAQSDFFNSRFAKALEASPLIDRKKVGLSGSHSELSNPFSIEIRGISGKNTYPTAPVKTKTHESSSGGDRGTTGGKVNVIELSWSKDLKANPRTKTGSTTLSSSQPSSGSSRGNPFINMKLGLSGSITAGGSGELRRNLRDASAVIRAEKKMINVGSSSSSSRSTLSDEELGRIANRASAMSKGNAFIGKSDLYERSPLHKMMTQKRTSTAMKAEYATRESEPKTTYFSAQRLTNQLAPPSTDDIGSVDSSVSSISVPREHPVFGYSQYTRKRQQDESLDFDVVDAIGSVDSGTSSFDGEKYGNQRFGYLESHNDNKEIRHNFDQRNDDQSELSCVRRSKHLDNVLRGKTNPFLAQSPAKTPNTGQTENKTMKEVKQLEYPGTGKKMECRNMIAAPNRVRSQQSAGFNPQIPQNGRAYGQSRIKRQMHEHYHSKQDTKLSEESLNFLAAEKKLHRNGIDVAPQQVRTAQETNLTTSGGGAHRDDQNDVQAERTFRQPHDRSAAVYDKKEISDVGQSIDNNNCQSNTKNMNLKPVAKAADSKQPNANKPGSKSHQALDFKSRGEMHPDNDRIADANQLTPVFDDETNKSDTTHELTKLLASETNAGSALEPSGQPKPRAPVNVYTSLEHTADQYEDSSDSSEKKDPFLWLHKKYGDKSQAANQKAIQKAIARSTNEIIPSPPNRGSQRQTPARQTSEDDDDVFDGIDDESLLREDFDDLAFEDRLPVKHSLEPTNRKSVPLSKRKESVRLVHEDKYPQGEAMRQLPNKKQTNDSFAKHSGKTIGENFVNTVVSDITTSLITMEKGLLARHYRAQHNENTIHEEDHVDTIEVDTEEDGVCRKPPSVLVNISHAIVNSIQNVCKVPEKTDDGGCNTTVSAAKCGEKLNETWAILNSHTNEDDAANTISGGSVEQTGTGTVTGTGTETGTETETKAGETMTTNMFNEMERRIWEAWDRRNKKAENDENPIENCEVNETSSSSQSGERAENYQEALDTAKNSLLAHAGRALELFGHTIARSGSTASDSSFTRPNPVGSPHSRLSSNLSFNEQSNLERFSSALKNEGIEVLKLGSRNKWQVRYLTVSREVTKLGSGGVAGDIGQCPKALLWPKQFKEQFFSISSIKGDGRGGVLFDHLKNVRPTVSNEFYDLHLPKKLKATFPEFAGAVLDYEHEHGERQLHLCFKTKGDAQAFITAMLIIKEATERNVPQITTHGLVGDVENRPGYAS